MRHGIWHRVVLLTLGYLSFAGILKQDRLLAVEPPAASGFSDSPKDNRYGPLNLFDHRSMYGMGTFPEPFLIDDSDLEVNELRAPVGELSQLVAGQLLSLGRSVTQPASLRVAGVEMFRAAPARAGSTRAAQIRAATGEAEGALPGIPATKEARK